MIDIILMYNLMKAIPEHMRLVLVGDIKRIELKPVAGQ